MQRRVGWLIVSLSVLLSACSVKFTYNQLDWLIPWYVDDFIEFEGGQTQLFETELGEYLDWHRTEALPKYAKFLQLLAQSSEQSWQVDQQQFTAFSSVQIEQLENRLKRLLDETFLPLVPSTAALIRQLEPQQIEQIRRGFSKSNEAFNEPYLHQTSQAIQAYRAEKVTEFFERFLGDLSSEQLLAVRQWQQKALPMHEVLLRTRLAWQAHFLELLTKAPTISDQVLSQKLTQLLTEAEQFRSMPDQAIYAQNQRNFRTLLQSIQTLMTQDQYWHLQDVLRDLIDDINALAADR